MAWSKKTSHAKVLQRSSKAGRAFIVESLVLFVFLVATLIIVSMLFFSSISMSVQGQDLERATLIASNTAERFSADPTSTDLDASEYGLTVNCDVTPKKSGDGTLYQATITVSDENTVIYTIKTSRYVSGVS